jgi:N-acetylmuramoyl-L-alanine amidase
LDDVKTSHIIDHIPKDTPYNRRPGLPLAPEYITVHSTGNPGSTARNEWAWLTNPANKRTASWHICVDDKEAIEAIPLSEVAWHAGDGASGPGNRKSIAVEICESGDRAKTLENAAELTARLLRERNWGTERLRRHWDWSGKACPRIFVADNWAGWENFKRDVQKHLESSNEEQAAQKHPEGSSKEHTAPRHPEDSTKEQTVQRHPADSPETLPQIQRRVEGTLNGRPVEFESYLINNTAYVPLRPLAAALGLQLEWKEGKYQILTGAVTRVGTGVVAKTVSKSVARAVTGTVTGVSDDK